MYICVWDGERDFGEQLFKRFGKEQRLKTAVGVQVLFLRLENQKLGDIFFLFFRLVYCTFIIYFPPLFSLN